MSRATIRDPPEVGSIWFDDGNLIVIAEPKVFRLYQGLLARRSPIIKDLLSIPGADTVIDEADRSVIDALGRDTTGCAVVRFTDKPQEVEWFLSAFIGDSLSGQFSKDISALAGILRLATKYEVNSLRKWAVECLEQVLRFTTDLNADELLERTRQKGTGVRWMDGMLPLIDVAATVGVQWLLPILFWHLQSASLSDVLHHAEWRDFPEARKAHFLLCREAARDDAVSAFAVVARLHRDGSSHDASPHGQCMDRFNDALHQAFTRAGPKAVNTFDWERYAETRNCGMCKESYVTVAREVAIDAFVSRQKQTGLPGRSEMMEQREKFFQDVSMNDA